MKPPSNPDSWVHRQPGGVSAADPPGSGEQGVRAPIGTRSERERAARLGALLEDRLVKERQRPRKDRFLPFLLVRTSAGDHGDRPLSGVFWESPDIWVAPGRPEGTPEMPSSPGGAVTAGQPNTVYAHVWNLGKAPIAGVAVEFYWADPSLVIDAANVQRIGVARVDLGPRNSLTCHRLVKCPTPWVPVFVNRGHECLIVRVRALGDDPDPTSWHPGRDRRIAQRNMSVVAPEALSEIMKSLDRTMLPKSSLHLTQVGGKDAPPLTLLDRSLLVDPRIQTQVLAVLRQDGRIETPAASVRGRVVIPSILLKLTTTTDPSSSKLKISSSALKANLGNVLAPTAPKNLASAPTPDALNSASAPKAPVAPSPATTLTNALKVPVSATREALKAMAATLRTSTLAPPARMATPQPTIPKVRALLDFYSGLPKDQRDKLLRAPLPRSGTAQVLRITNVDEQGNIVGGYTLVVRG